MESQILQLTVVLLYQPLRRQPELRDAEPSRSAISALLVPFLRIIKEAAGVSELVALLVSPQSVASSTLTAVPRSSEPDGTGRLH